MKLYPEELGFEVLMQALKGKRPKLTTEKSNFSHYVIKTCSVFKSDHGFVGKK